MIGSNGWFSPILKKIGEGNLKIKGIGKGECAGRPQQGGLGGFQIFTPDLKKENPTKFFSCKSVKCQITIITFELLKMKVLMRVKSIFKNRYKKKQSVNYSINQQYVNSYSLLCCSRRLWTFKSAVCLSVLLCVVYLRKRVLPLCQSVYLFLLLTELLRCNATA